MADGDYNVRELGRSRMQGGGHNLAGAAKNDKVVIWGQIAYTYNTGGLVVPPSRLGLSAIDIIMFGNVLGPSSAAPTESAPWHAVYTTAAEGSGNVIVEDTAGNEQTDSTTSTLSFFAVGSALNADLT